jgi:transcriptional regulator
MYIPSAFKVESPERIAQFIQKHSFATLLTTDSNQVPVATHLPVLCENRSGDEFVVLGHMARANPQWKSFRSTTPSAAAAATPDSEEQNAGEVLVIFQGPHAYISPSWYASSVAVPTWNYTAVHVYGNARLMTTDEELENLLAKTVSKFEQPLPKPWTDQNSPELREQLKKAIVGFEIEVTRIDAKFKLNQNRSVEDAQGACDVLSGSANQIERELADLMREEIVNARQN